MAADVAQCEHSNIKCYASAFSNIQISILKLKKTNFKLLNNYRKYGGNDMAANVAQCERSNIKCYASAFSNIQMMFTIFFHQTIL